MRAQTVHPLRLWENKIKKEKCLDRSLSFLYSCLEPKSRCCCIIGRGLCVPDAAKRKEELCFVLF